MTSSFYLELLLPSWEWAWTNLLENKKTEQNRGISTEVILEQQALANWKADQHEQEQLRSAIHTATLLTPEK